MILTDSQIYAQTDHATTTKIFMVKKKQKMTNANVKKERKKEKKHKSYTGVNNYNKMK